MFQSFRRKRKEGGEGLPSFLPSSLLSHPPPGWLASSQATDWPKVGIFELFILTIASFEGISCSLENRLESSNSESTRKLGLEGGSEEGGRGYPQRVLDPPPPSADCHFPFPPSSLSTSSPSYPAAAATKEPRSPSSLFLSP